MAAGPGAGVDRRTEVRRLGAFFALAYALSWAWAVPLALTGAVVVRGEGWPTHYPVLVGPALAAVVVTAATTGRHGLTDLLRRLVRWRVGRVWWLAAVSPALLLAPLLAVMAVTGQELPRPADFASFSGTPRVGLLGVVLLITIVGALGEEVGWRGYALEHLQRLRGPVASTLILAPLWAAWHLPMSGVVETYRDFGPVQVAGMVLGLTCGAFVLTWLYNRSGGSILLVVVWHGLYNTVAATEAAAGALAAVVSMLVVAQAAVLLVLEARARRAGRPSILDPRPSVAPEAAAHRARTHESP